MIVFPQFRTRRIVADMEEISMRFGLRVAGMPEDQTEESETIFLKSVLSINKGPDSVLDWTFQERVLAVAHYMMTVSEGGADFALGERGKLSDYLDADTDYPAGSDRIAIGEVGGDAWFCQHLTGGMVESIERTQGEVEDVQGRMHWLTGAMAAQLVRDQDELVDTANAGAYDDFLIHRMRTMLALPESDYTMLLVGYLDAKEKQHHLFDYDFAQDGGILILPHGKGVAADLPPARFPVRTCLSPATIALCGKPEKSRT